MRVLKISYIWKNFIWNPAACNWENGITALSIILAKYLYLASIIDNLVITCDEITEPEAQSYDKETKEL